MTLINYSEFDTLTDCEQRWLYKYVLDLPEEGKGVGRKLGTLCHLWHGNWLQRKGAFVPDHWDDDIAAGGKPGEVVHHSIQEFDPDIVVRAIWLKERFIEVYGEEPPANWNVISSEQWMSREFEWGTLVGRTDGFVEIDGNLWLIEVKSYGSRPGPLAYAQVSPQLGCYSLLAERAFGQRPFGIRYQGIYTYRWAWIKPTQKSVIEQWELEGRTEGQPKKDVQAAAKLWCADSRHWTERPASESFDDLEIEFGSDHLRTAERYLAAATRRREQLEDNHDEALPNVGQRCNGCDFKAHCWSDLGGVEEFEIEVVDEDEANMEPV